MNDLLLPAAQPFAVSQVNTRKAPRIAAAVLVMLCAASTLAAPFSFSPTGSMNTERYWHTATLLRTGVVLAAGGGGAGEVQTAELYDPATGSWTATGNLTMPRAFHTATRLRDGRVLVAGGHSNGTGNQPTAELYDPASGTWSITGSMAVDRVDHTATLLDDGRVLVTGGNFQAFAELYDPASGTWSITGTLNGTRAAHRATLLQNGKVLITGGRRINSLADCELYDPATGTFSPTGNMAAPRALHSATLLASGKVLVVGGFDYGTGKPLATAELYDPASGSWSSAGSLALARDLHTGTLLPGGRVLVAGGIGSNGFVLANSQLYDPASGSWTSTGSLHTARTTHTATLLPNGNVLVTGGDGPSAHELASAELYLTEGADTTLRNISTRLPVETGDKVLIGGFIIDGSAPKKVIVRALGPSLTAGGIGGALSDPTLELNKPDGTTVFNDNWRENEAAVQATTIPPSRDEESAIVATLAPGAYTAIVKGKAGETGVALVEVYDLETTVPSVLANISTRGAVQTGDKVLIGGFIVAGSTNVTQVAVRAIGPSLSQSGLSDVLADPTLDLRNSDGERLIFNDNWEDDQASAQQLTARNLVPPRPEEAAIFTILPPGHYTAIVAGENGGTGVGLVEVYNIP